MKKLSKNDLKLKGQVVTGLTDRNVPTCQDSKLDGDCVTKDTMQECYDTLRQCTFDTLQICQYTKIDSCNGNETNYDTCAESDVCIVDSISGGELCCLGRTYDTECPDCVVILPSVTECQLTDGVDETCELAPCNHETDDCISVNVCEQTSDCPETQICWGTEAFCKD